MGSAANGVVLLSLPSSAVRCFSGWILKGFRIAARCFSACSLSPVEITMGLTMGLTTRLLAMRLLAIGLTIRLAL
jgi:hypothetical protein